MSNEPLEDELARLRGEVHDYRVRELESLRAQLAEAKAEAVHFRSESQRTADLGRKIYSGQQAEIDRLRTRLAALEQIPNARTAINRP